MCAISVAQANKILFHSSNIIGKNDIYILLLPITKNSKIFYASEDNVVYIFIVHYARHER